MSADNYLYVRPWRGRFYVEQRFASCDYDERRKPHDGCIFFARPEDAIKHAHGLDHLGYYEYGVKVHPSAFTWEPPA